MIVMNKKHKHWIFCFCIFMLIYSIGVLIKENLNTPDVASDFLKEFYEITNTKEEVTMDQLIQSYNEKFNLYLTEECLTSLWKNRDIIEYLSFLKKIIVPFL